MIFILQNKLRKTRLIEWGFEGLFLILYFLWSLHNFKRVKIKIKTPPPSLGWET